MDVENGALDDALVKSSAAGAAEATSGGASKAPAVGGRAKRGSANVINYAEVGIAAGNKCTL